MKKNIIKSNSMNNNFVICGVSKMVSMILSYVYIPLVLDYLGIEKYGVWSTILTIMSWISYFDIGIGNGLRNKLTEALSKKCFDKGKELVSSAYAFIFALIGVVVLAFCIIAFQVNWEKIFGVNNLSENLTVIICICFLVTGINFVLSLCKSVLFAIQEAGVVSVMELSVQVLNVVGILIIKQYTSQNLFIMPCVYGSSMILTSLFFNIYTFTQNKVLAPSIRYVNVATGKSLTSLGMQFFVIQICALILFTTDSLIISCLYGASEVTPYNTVNKLFGAILGIYAAFGTPIWSGVTKYAANNEFLKIRKLLKKILFLTLPFFVGAMFLGVFFRQVSVFWLGKDLDYSNSLIIFGVIYCVLSVWGNLFSSFANGLELMKCSMTVAFLQAVINIPLSLFLAVYLDMKSAGVLAGTALVLLIGSIIIPICVIRAIKIKDEI